MTQDTPRAWYRVPQPPSRPTETGPERPWGDPAREPREPSGIVAILKHVAGCSASRAGRNLAPVSMGPREFADVILPPFEMAREGGARSVMHSCADVDGVPAAANRELLTDLFREQRGFTGTIVADCFGVEFLQSLHGIAGSGGKFGASSHCNGRVRGVSWITRAC